MSRTLAGRCIPAFLFICCRCFVRKLINDSNGLRLTQADAASWVRGAGWSKTKTGWICPECKAHKPASATLAIKSISVELESE